MELIQLLLLVQNLKKAFPLEYGRLEGGIMAAHLPTITIAMAKKILNPLTIKKLLTTRIL